MLFACSGGARVIYGVEISAIELVGLSNQPAHKVSKILKRVKKFG